MVTLPGEQAVRNKLLVESGEKALLLLDMLDRLELVSVYPVLGIHVFHARQPGRWAYTATGDACTGPYGLQHEIGIVVRRYPVKVGERSIECSMRVLLDGKMHSD